MRAVFTEGPGVSEDKVESGRSTEREDDFSMGRNPSGGAPQGRGCPVSVRFRELEN